MVWVASSVGRCGVKGKVQCSVSRELLLEAVGKIGHWVEEHDYRGYEPFDGLSSVFRPLTFGNLLLERILLQSIRQSPINIRPLMGVRPHPSTKGRGYMAAAYLTMYRLLQDPAYKEHAESCLSWLMEHKSKKFKEYSWGNHFDFVGRGGGYSRDEPIIVWTSLIGQAFLDAFETIGDQKYLDVADSVCRWIVNLPREETERGTCLSYVAFAQSSIHNSNLLGAAMLARSARLCGRPVYEQLARDAVRYSCERQLEDGSWYYGEDPKYQWIDNFHTGYNLDSLKCHIDSTGDTTYSPHLTRGYRFYVDHFFEPSGRPRYYHNRTYPVDSQCIAQSVETLANFSDVESSALPLACKVARWTIENMLDKKGFVYYRQYPGGIVAKTPMLHWAQATTYKALCVLVSKFAGEATLAASR